VMGFWFVTVFVVATLAFDKQTHDRHVVEQARKASKHIYSLKPQVPVQLQDASVPCVDSVLAFLAFLADPTNPCQNITTLFDANQTDASLNGLLSSICPGSCFNTYINLTTTIAIECKGQEDVSTIPSREVLMQLQNLTCLNIDGTYCYITLRDFFTAINESAITEATLTAGCTECTVEALRIYLQLAGDPLDLDLLAYAELDLLCMRRENTWCALQWNASATIFEANTTLQNLPVVCHPCTFAYLNRIKIIYENIYWVTLALLGPSDPATVKAQIAAFNLSIDLTALGFACVTDLDGDYCAIELAAYPDGWANQACATNSSSSACPASCQAVVKGFVNNTGCCAGTYFHYLEWVCDVKAAYGSPCSTSPYAIVEFLQVGCDVVIPEGCWAQKNKFLATIIFENLEYDWCVSNLTLCLDVIRDVILYRSGITNASLPLTITGTTASSPSRRLLQSVSQVQVQFSPASEDFANLSSILSDLTSTEPGNNGFNSFPADGRTNANQAVTLSASIDTGVAASVRPTLLLLGGILAVVALV